jgi:hypothetical protein
MFPLLLFFLAASGPGERTLLDAHNCYPYEGKFADRLPRALALPMPIAIEQDLVWSGNANRVSHEREHANDAPTLEDHFFAPLRARMEAALKSADRSQWPLVTLNLDFKTAEPQQIENLHALLTKYRPWLSIARKGAAGAIEAGPMLVLLGDQDANEEVFYSRLRSGGEILAFGAAPGCAVHTEYRRWCNFAFRQLLKVPNWQTYVQAAHSKGFWVRVYTINGASEEESAINGWSKGYRAGSREAAERLWQDFSAAKVDFIATDEYEAFAAWRKRLR